MIRVILEEASIFLIPFVAFAIYLVLRQRNPMRWDAWSDQAFWLVLGGFAFAIAGFVISGIVAPRDTRGFEPTHVEGGRVVPGRFR